MIFIGHALKKAFTVFVESCFRTTLFKHSCTHHRVSVSDTKAEIKLTPATVTANSLKSRPEIPLRNMIGRKTAASVIVVEMMAKMISSDPCELLHRFFALFIFL